MKCTDNEGLLGWKQPKFRGLIFSMKCPLVASTFGRTDLRRSLTILGHAYPVDLWPEISKVKIDSYSTANILQILEPQYQKAQFHQTCLLRTDRNIALDFAKVLGRILSNIRMIFIWYSQSLTAISYFEWVCVMQHCTGWWGNACEFSISRKRLGRAAFHSNSIGPTPIVFHVPPCCTTFASTITVMYR